MQDVEYEGDNRFRIPFAAERCLQRLEAALAFCVQDHRFHIQYDTFRLQRFQRTRERGKSFRPILAIPGAQTAFSVRDKAEQAVAVELDFMQPVLAFRVQHRQG